MAVLWKRLSCIVMDVRTNDGYMLIAKCFTLDGNGVSGLEVRGGGKGRGKTARAVKSGVSHMHRIIQIYIFSNKIYDFVATYYFH
jgi:hypothetical protein